MPDEQEVGVIFPLSGLDTTCEFGRQPVNTTPIAVNVRSTETITGRTRGGSRAGMGKFNPEQVNGVSAEVQHMNLLVDPTEPALRADADTGEIDDPSTNNFGPGAGGIPGGLRNPGRRLRRGGSGRQPNRNRPHSTLPIEFVQKYRVQPGNISSLYTLTLPNQPGIQNLLLVIIRTEKPGASAELVQSVKNSQLNDYTQVDQPGYTSDVTFDIGGGTTTESLSVWSKVASAGVPDQTIRVLPGSSGVYEIIVLEYRYNSTTSPISNKARASNAAASASWSIGPLPLNNTFGQAVVAAYCKINTVVTINSSGYIGRFGVNGDPNSEAANTVVIERTGLSGVGPENPTVADTLIPRPFCGFAVALTK